MPQLPDTGFSSYWSTSHHESVQWVQRYQHITFCFPGGPSTAPSFQHWLFFFIILLSYHGRPVIWVVSFNNVDLASAELQPLILSLLFLAPGVNKILLKKYLQSLCVSLMRHVFILTSIPCGNLRPNVNSSAAKLRGKKLY